MDSHAKKKLKVDSTASKLPKETSEGVSEIRIRQMQLKDAAKCFHLGESVFRSDTFPQLYRTWDSFEITDTLSSDPELCLIAEELSSKEGREGKKGAHKQDGDEEQTMVVGFVLGHITEKKRKDQTVGYLCWVAIAEPYQRRGIGTLIVQRMIDNFVGDGISSLMADTPEQNHAARRFLEKLGFGSPVNHVYMSLNISKAAEDGGAKSKSKMSGTIEGKSYKIREMTIDDLSPVFELGEQVYTSELYPNLFRIWSEAEVIETYGSDSENCFIFELDNKLVGFCLGTTIEKRRNAWKYGYLVWLGVSPEAQRFGIGRRLFNVFREEMIERGCRMLMIDTQKDNVPALRFFEKLGFGGTENHIYFSKFLPSEGAENGNSQVDADPTMTRQMVKLVRYKKVKSVGSGIPSSRQTRVNTEKKTTEEPVPDKSGFRRSPRQIKK